MSNNYAINSNKPAFAVADDDMESAFLQSSGAPNMANSTRMSYNSSGPKPYSPPSYDANSPEEQYRTTIQQIQDVEKRTLDSTKRSMQAIAESEQVGVETAKDLVHQREQLENTNKRLDNMNQDLKESQKIISAIKSVFSSFWQWMGAPKPSKDDKSNSNKRDSSVSSPTAPAVELNFDHNPKLENAVNIAPQYPDPSLRLRGVEYESSSQSGRYDGPSNGNTDDWKNTTKKVNKQLDTDVEEMSFGVSRLKGLAEGLGQEITEQNTLVDSITKKADKTDINLTSTNKQINTLLKK